LLAWEKAGRLAKLIAAATSGRSNFFMMDNFKIKQLNAS
jgi:hypothetical protein